MTISDPAQLLHRIPELEALSSDPRIGRAIESGDPFKVFRALMMARLLRRLPLHSALLRELTGQRRLFARPLKGTPSLGSINSVGFNFIGEAEPDTDGSHIALHAFVVLFKIPLIPLGAYVVKDTGNRSWQIYARAPLGIPGWLYTRGLATALVLLVGAGAVHSFETMGHQDLLILNGFEAPLTVALQGQNYTVPAQQRLNVTVKTGTLHASASSGNTSIDTLDTSIASSGMLSIWNVAGATPLLRNTVVYTRDKATGPEPDGAHTVYCGQRFIELADVRYQFVQPPATMSMSKHSNSVSVQQIEVASRPGSAGPTVCIAYLMDHGAASEGARLLAVLAELNHWSDQYGPGAIFATEAVSRRAALVLARRAVKARPDSLSLARSLQDLRQQNGEYDAMLAEHRQRAQAHPDSADEQYLYAALLSRQQGIDLLQQLHARFPEHALILRSLAWRKAGNGDAAGALQDLQRLHTLAPADAQRLLGAEARALLALNRGADALALLDAGARDDKDNNQVEHARDYALLARQLGSDKLRTEGGAQLETRLHAERLGSSDYSRARDFQRICVGLSPLDPDSGKTPAIRLALALRAAPGEAMKLAPQVSRLQMAGFTDSQRALVYGEAVRTGNAALIKSMEGMLSVSGADDLTLQRYLRGEAASIAGIDMDLDAQAAAMFIRSRNAALPAAERGALREQAARTELLHGAVHTALNEWQG